MVLTRLLKKPMEKTRTSGLKEGHANVNTLIKSESEATTMATYEDEVDPSGTRSSKNLSQRLFDSRTEQICKSI